MSGHPIEPGPLSQIGLQMEHLAKLVKDYRPLQMEPIPITWVDRSFEEWMDQGTAVETRTVLRKKFFALMSTAGITDKEVQLEVIEAILGRLSQRRQPITSRKDLTISELGRLTQALQDWETIEGYAS